MDSIYIYNVSNLCIDSHTYIDEQCIYYLWTAFLYTELTGCSEGGGSTGTGGRGGVDYVVSSKWARDTDINFKIRSNTHAYIRV